MRPATPLPVKEYFMILKSKIGRRQFGIGLIFSAAALAFSLNMAIAGDAKTMDGKVIEIVTFKLAAGVSDEAFSKHTDVVNSYISSRKGFISRRLSRAADGTYLDHVTWESLSDATTAMESSMKEASLATFMQSIDPATVKIDHQILTGSIN
jgi:hypothetical protein